MRSTALTSSWVNQPVRVSYFNSLPLLQLDLICYLVTSTNLRNPTFAACHCLCGVTIQLLMLITAYQVSSTAISTSNA
ncbi:hypothetical protein T07_10859 [Trichinella nelsoni]|uniref:Uncharacterized protein n=1 Tax=Trichinella nelsoni TaxID=6336 RepID=A0A0V0RH75_9BILA|nr:hypothetical protein T07_10859 [Trichinella nelsoni]